jgi:predicted nucleic-acid-binding Zn-ribbon protein
MFIKKWICVRKVHDFEFTHIEPDGWGNEWHWKKCKKCGYSTFDVKKINA